MKSFLGLSLIGLLAASASAHMEVTNPPPFKSKNNPNAGQDIDYSMTNPLDKAGGDFPCKGYHSLMGTPAGASVANYQPGQTYSFTLAGSATHNGGSCQVSLSYDQGASWTVIHSYIGNCPLKPEWSFTLPNDTPSGSALWAWSWWNNLGNREMYMNCAHVTVGGGRTNEIGDVEVDADFNATLAERGPGDPFASRPKMFVANVGNGCETVETFDVQFPNPGPDVTNDSQKTNPPVGNCGARRAMALKA